jgi:hypothetical protein
MKITDTPIPHSVWCPCHVATTDDTIDTDDYEIVHGFSQSLHWSLNDHRSGYHAMLSPHEVDDWSWGEFYACFNSLGLEHLCRQPNEDSAWESFYEARPLTEDEEPPPSDDEYFLEALEGLTDAEKEAKIKENDHEAECFHESHAYTGSGFVDTDLNGEGISLASEYQNTSSFHVWFLLRHSDIESYPQTLTQFK